MTINIFVFVWLINSANITTSYECVCVYVGLCVCDVSANSLNTISVYTHVNLEDKKILHSWLFQEVCKYRLVTSLWHNLNRSFTLFLWNLNHLRSATQRNLSKLEIFPYLFLLTGVSNAEIIFKIGSVSPEIFASRNLNKHFSFITYFHYRYLIT